MIWCGSNRKRGTKDLAWALGNEELPLIKKGKNVDRKEFREAITSSVLVG